MAMKIGQWAFILGIALAIIVGVFTLSETVAGTVTLVLVILGLIVGFLNITEKETTPFLIAAIALLATGSAVDSLKVIPPKVLGDFLASSVNNIAAFVTPAAILVAVKAIWALAKD